MSSNIKMVWEAAQSLLSTGLEGLANNATFQSALQTNTSPSATKIKIQARIQMSASAVTANSLVDFYLLRADGASPPNTNVGTDKCGQAATTMGDGIINAQPLFSLLVSATTAGYEYCCDFVIDDPGVYWAIAIVNRSGQALHAATSTHSVTYQYGYPQAA